MPITWFGEAYDYPADPVSGATRVRLTTSLKHHVNVYVEHSYSSPDGRRIAILRSFLSDPRLPPYDLMVGDLYTLRIAVIEENVASVLVGTASWSGWIYYVTSGGALGSASGGAAGDLMRVNLSTLEKEVVWTRWPFEPGFILHTVSPDLRFLVGQRLQSNYKTALIRLDLVEREWKVIYEDYEISNAHPLFNPVHGRDLIVMKAAGFAVNDRYEVKDLGTPRYTTHLHIDADGGNVRELPFGRHFCPDSTGHSQWIADTGRMAIAAGWDVTTFKQLPSSPEGNIYTAAPGDAAPRVFPCPEHVFQHIATSKCGKYFVAESYAAGLPGAVPLIVGNFRTNKWRVLLSNCQARGGAATCSHPHAYFTADNQHVIYNADPCMVGHVYAARVPEGFLASLD